MTITVTINSVCPGGNHIFATVNDGQDMLDRVLNVQDLLEEIDINEFVDPIIQRLRSDCKEHGVTTSNGIQALINGKTYSI